MSDRMTIISSMATRQILLDLIAADEGRAGSRADLRPMGGVDAARFIRESEHADVIILASQVMKQLESEGWVLSGSQSGFASSGIAMAVRAGAPHPNIHDEQSARQVISQARSACYSTGPSGDHILKLCERWGILDSFLQRSLKAPSGIPVSALVARGDADIGFQQLSELLRQPGIDIVGELPAEIQLMTVFSAGVGKMAAKPKEARSLIAYLTSPEAETTKCYYGMTAA